MPAGTFLTGAIHLKSNVNLHVDAGATLKFDTNPASYPLVFTRWEGMELINYSPLIYARREKNIAFTGQSRSSTRRKVSGETLRMTFTQCVS